MPLDNRSRVPGLQAASRPLSERWQRGEHWGELPSACRPRDRAEGYAVLAGWAAGVGQSVAAWKIAATSVAGQRHINVSAARAVPSGPSIGCCYRCNVVIQPS